MKFAWPSLVTLALLSACSSVNLAATAGKGTPGITPNNGPWYFAVQDHPEVSKVYNLTFGSIGTSPLITINGGPGDGVQVPVDWRSGNFDLYITANTPTGYGGVTKKISAAIQSASLLNGIIIYNADPTGGIPQTGGGLGGLGYGSNGQPGYQANFIATFGASPMPYPSASGAPSAPPSSPAAAASAAPPAPSASPVPGAR